MRLSSTFPLSRSGNGQFACMSERSWKSWKRTKAPRCSNGFYPLIDSIQPQPRGNVVCEMVCARMRACGARGCWLLGLRFFVFVRRVNKRWRGGRGIPIPTTSAYAMCSKQVAGIPGDQEFSQGFLRPKPTKTAIQFGILLGTSRL